MNSFLVTFYIVLILFYFHLTVNQIITNAYISMKFTVNLHCLNARFNSTNFLNVSILNFISGKLLEE